MGVSYSRASDRDRGRRPSVISLVFASRRGELAGLLLGALIVAFGLWLVYRAKTGEAARTPFAEVEAQLKEKKLLDLTMVKSARDLTPFLTVFRDPAERRLAAAKISSFVRARRELPNVGALAAITIERKNEESGSGVPAEAFAIDPRCKTEERIAQKVLAKEKAGQEAEDEDQIEDEDDREQPSAAAQTTSATPPPAASTTRKTRLLTDGELSRLKSSFIVRRPEQFKSAFLWWAFLSLLVFFAIHVGWRLRGFTGDQLALPVIQFLCGLGLILMVSLRDPLRDQLSFREFAQGVIGGGLILFVASQIDYRRWFGERGLWLWLAALALAVALIFFGKGPGASDAKVNLFGAQPAEAIKILIVMFLAGYLAGNWEFLRELSQKGGGFFTPLQRLFQRWKIPRLTYFLPVAAAMAIALGMFFLLKDLGPAMALACAFLSLYAVARNRAWLVAGGAAILVFGGWLAYELMTPRTVYQRMRIWLSPWENGLRNGDQIAHSLWAFSTGEAGGTGPGLGDVSVIPAGHTDLIISSLGEEFGFIGVLAVFSLYALLVARGFRAALQAENEYSFFLALGLTLITAWQILLISCGILGLFPLSGVVSPFLSYGRSSMLANFYIFGAILAVSTQRHVKGMLIQFLKPVKKLALVLGALAALVLGKAALVQIVNSDDNLVAGVLTRQADGIYRYVYNPRLARAKRELPMGTIYDRTGLPLATSKWEELKKEENLRRYAEMGIDIDDVCAKDESRHYPFGGKMYYLLGGARTREEAGAARLGVEDQEDVLRGFDDHARLVGREVVIPDPRTRELKTERIEAAQYDYHELIPLVRYRRFPQHPEARRLMEKNRDLKLTIDARLQLRVSELVKAEVEKARKERGQSQKGAAVVMDPQNGDLLAVVSYPWPEDAPVGFARQTLANNQGNQSGADEDAVYRMKLKKMAHDRCFIDRARIGRDAPGSTFKLVTAIAALSKDRHLAEAAHRCVPLADGRVGANVEHRGAKVVIRDDKNDPPHGVAKMACGIQASCNAYFAQLGVMDVGAKALFDTASKFEISVARKNNWTELDKYLPQSAYGQGQVATDVFHITRVAATVASGGVMAYGRVVAGENDQRAPPPERILSRELADEIALDMRRVVEHGTGKRLKVVSPPIAGKTGTAETGKRTEPHAWFTGFAPYGGGGPRIAFTVFIANSGYGGEYAAPVAEKIVKTAAELNIISPGVKPPNVGDACSSSR